MKRTFKYALITVLGAAVVLPALAQDNFPDVPTDPPHWAMKALEEMKREGILVGYPDGLFRGGRPASRYELAVAVHATYMKLKGMYDGLDSQVKALTDKINGMPGGNADDLKALRDQLTSLQNDVNGMKGWGDDISKLKDMASTFEKELASMGVDVEAMKKDLQDLADRVGKLEKRKPAVDISGDANLLVLGGHGRSNNLGVTPGGRLTGVGRGSYFDAPSVGINRDLSVFHEAAFTFKGTNEDGPKWHATLVAGNMITPGALGSQSTRSLGAGFMEGSADVYFQDFGVNFDTSISGLGFSAEIGRLGYQISPYLFKRPDYTDYFSNPRWDNGDWYLDGALVRFKFGMAGVDVFAGRNSARNTVNGIDINPMGIFGSNSVPPGLPGSLIDQSLGIRVNAPLGEMGQINLAYLWLDSNTKVGTGIATGANRNNVFGGDLRFNLGQNLNIAGGYSKTVLSNNTVRVLDNDNAAIFGNLGYTAGNWGANVGWRRVEQNYSAPGDWGRMGTFWNPTNVEGLNAYVWLNLSPEFRLTGRGEFDREVNAIDSGDPDRTKFNSYSVQADYKLTTSWNLMANYEYTMFDRAASGVADPKENWFTVGLGYALGANAKLDIRYQVSDVKDAANSIYTGLGASRYRGGLLSTQVSIKF